MKNEECQIYRDRLIALAEDPVGPEAEPGLLAHLRDCPRCDAEYRWLTGLCAELEAAGDAMARKAPAVDLTAGVMAAVARLQRPRLVELPAAQPRRRWTRRAWIGAAAAAAAVVLAAAWFALSPGAPTTPNVAVRPAEHPAPAAPEPERIEVAQAPAPVEQNPPSQNPEELVNIVRPDTSASTEPAPGALAAFDLQEVLAARKEAAANPAARRQLAQWAQVAAERAKELAASEESSLAAKVGAAGSLPADEAQRVLMAAVEAEPDNPYLRYALGEAYREQPEDAAKAAAEFAAQAQLDPENALPWYQLAATMLDQGDAESAAAALDTARALTGAHPYTIEAAGYQQEALVETGVAEDVARLLVALTAGTSEYGDLVTLGMQLLDHGKQYEDNGQTDLAQQIYDSVRVMGSQLSDTAVFSGELVAGLDMQREAIGLLSGLAQFIEQPGNADLLARQTQQVVQSLNTLGSFFTSVNTFFEGDPGTDAMRMFAQFVLGNGDLSVLDFLFNQQPRQ